MKYLKDWGVDEWKRLEIKTRRDAADLYYKPYEVSGFEFKVLEETIEDDEGSVLKRVVEGVAYFDGLRHVTFGDEDGYTYYPDPNLLVVVFQTLALLEKNFCQEDQL
jgi:hypothetical protein